MFIAFVKRNERTFVLFGLALILFSVGFDILIDWRDGLPLNHLGHELAIFLFCSSVTGFQVNIIRRQRRTLQANGIAIADLLETRDTLQRRSSQFASDFSSAVNNQFTRWGLTESEQDVAILLVQGLSMKEIAESRASRETTVRQQAAAVYRKANLNGRKELTAFFLEDLFNPAG